MKAIMISIKPKWVVKILNGEKTIEIRKTCPKDWKDYLSGKTKVKPEPRIVFLYCTMSGDRLLEITCGNEVEYKLEKECDVEDLEMSSDILNGKVVARFYCYKVEEISYNYRGDYTSVYTDTLDTEDLEKQACLTRYEFADYLQTDYGYAVHISNLEIFDKPKEIIWFKPYCEKLWFSKQCRKCKYFFFPRSPDAKVECLNKHLSKAPQSWCYVEVEE